MAAAEEQAAAEAQARAEAVVRAAAESERAAAEKAAAEAKVAIFERLARLLLCIRAVSTELPLSITNVWGILKSKAKAHPSRTHFKVTGSMAYHIPYF